MENLKFKNLLWINLQNPEKESLKKLQKSFRFHDLDIEDCLSSREQAKMEIHSKHIFLIFKFPFFNKKTRLFQIEELKIFLGKNFILTIHSGKLKKIDKIFQEAKEKLKIRRQFFKDGHGKFLWEILKTLFADIFPSLDKMSLKIKKMEKEIFENHIIKNRLSKILILKRNLITLKRILLPQRGVMLELEKIKVRFLPDHLEIFFDDILDKIEKLIEISSTLQDLVESLRETNETMITHSLNNTIKVLTVFSAVMLPLTFITGLFGMNVAIPYEEKYFSFLSILLGMFFLGILMLSFFKWRKWI